MTGRLLLGLLGGLGKGMAIAGGGRAVSGLARMALGGKGGRGGTAGGKGRGGRQEESSPLQEFLRLLPDERAGHDGERGRCGRARSPEASLSGMRSEADAASGQLYSDETALRCLAEHCVSFTEGRVRVRHSALRAVAVPEDVRRQLLEHPGLREATFNPVTGSALLLYDAEILDRPGLLAAALPLGRYLAQSTMEASRC